MELLAILESVIRLLRLLMPACSVCLCTVHDRSSMSCSCCPRRPVGSDGPTNAKPVVVVVVLPLLVVVLPFAPPSVNAKAWPSVDCDCGKFVTPKIAE